MPHYIFFTANIHPIGGMQTYVASKAKFLESEGWKVTVFFSGRNNDGGCAIKSLEKYKVGWAPEISIPPGNWPTFIRDSVLKNMCTQIGITDGKVIIESHAAAYMLWGELLAKQIGAKHFMILCNETFRGKDRFYEEYLDFFDFKHQRKEMAGGPISTSLLFEGYKYVPPEENYRAATPNEGPVQDVDNEAINKLQRMDWNICYIGRIEKGYVLPMIEDVLSFSRAHQNKKIQFIFVGDPTKRKQRIEETFSQEKNVKIVFLGNCVPIPRALYSKVDVVIGGSDCAVCSAKEGVLTIVADAKNFRANGVLGIDTQNAHYCVNNEPQMSYQEMLEKILVRGEYVDKQISNLPNPMPHEYYYREHFRLINESDQSVQYYDVIKNKKYSYKPSWMRYRLNWMAKILIRRHIPVLRRLGV